VKYKSYILIFPYRMYIIRARGVCLTSLNPDDKKRNLMSKVVSCMQHTVSRFDHDEAVRRYALHLLSEGYDVRARVEGWFQAPEYIYGYRPDIVARKGDDWLIVEVKKGEVDWPKINALERLRGERDHFRLVIASPEQVLAGVWAA
jgi:hypothetical protein